jgi:hypothetical protein
VRAYDDLTITSAVVVRDKTEIRFYTEEGRTLVWNWTTQTWGTNTDQPCLSATTGYTNCSGVVYARESDDYVLAEASEDAPVYREGGGAGTLYKGKARSPWYQIAGLAGWERIRRVQGVGETGDEHTATIRLYKNLSETAFSDLSIPFVGTEERWTWEVRPAQQKYSMVMVEVEIGVGANITMATHASDAYEGLGLWIFANPPRGEFQATDIGGVITIAGTPGGDWDGEYTITAVPSGEEVVMTPTPGGGVDQIDATSITFTPAPTAGPGLVGVSLLPISKEGMDKLPASRRAT